MHPVTYKTIIRWKSFISKIALAQLKNNPYKASLKLKRKKAGWDIGFLKELLDAEWKGPNTDKE